MKINKIILRFVSISFSVLILLLVAIGLVHLGQYCYEFGYRVFTEPAMAEEPGEDITVLVTDDMSELDIGRMLAEKQLIRDSYLFFAQLKLSAYSGKLLSGTYVLNTSMTAREMISIMAAVPIEDTETEEAETKTETAAPETEETEEVGEPEEASPEAAISLPGEEASPEVRL